MSIVLCVVLILIVGWGHPTKAEYRCYTNYCFYGYTDDLTYQQGSARCKDMGYELPILLNNVVQGELDSFLSSRQDVGPKDFWLNAVVDTTLTDWTWVSQEPFSESTEINGISQARYAAMYNNDNNLVIEAKSDEFHYRFLCEIGGYIMTDTDPNGNEYQSWFESRNYCISKGGDLAGKKVLSIPFSETQHHWIGLYKKRWNWIYSDQTTEEMKYTYWSNEESKNKNYSCVSTSSSDSNRWKISDCKQTKSVICMDLTKVKKNITTLFTILEPTNKPSSIKSITDNSKLFPSSFSQEIVTSTTSKNENRTVSSDSKKVLILAVAVPLVVIFVAVTIAVVIFLIKTKNGRCLKVWRQLHRKRTKSTETSLQRLPTTYVELSRNKNATNLSSTSNDNDAYANQSVEYKEVQRAKEKETTNSIYHEMKDPADTGYHTIGTSHEYYNTGAAINTRNEKQPPDTSYENITNEPNTKH